VGEFEGEMWVWDLLFLMFKIQPKEVLIKQMRKRLWHDQWRQHLDLIHPRVAQLRWLAIKCGFNQRLPND